MTEKIKALKLNKGHYGYLHRKKLRLVAEIALLLAGIIGLLVIGILATGSRRNLLTIVAVVTVLPMANLLVILIAIFPYHSAPQEEYEQVKALVGPGVMDTELVVTSRTDKSFQLDYAVIHEEGVLLYSDDKTLSGKQVEEYVTRYCDANSLSVRVTLMRDFKPFLRRIEALPAWDRATCDERLLKIEGVLRGISL